MVLSLYERYLKNKKEIEETTLKNLMDNNRIYADYVKRFKDNEKTEDEIKRHLIESGVCFVFIPNYDDKLNFSNNFNPFKEAVLEVIEKWKAEKVLVQFEDNGVFKFFLLNDRGKKVTKEYPDSMLNFWHSI